MKQILTLRLKRLPNIIDAIIQLHFDHIFTSWFPLLNKNLKCKLQAAQNKWVHFCLDLHWSTLIRSRIGAIHLERINWLQVSLTAESCIVTTIFKWWNGIVLSFVDGMFKRSCNRYNTRSQMTLDIPPWKTNTAQQASLFLGLKVWRKTVLRIRALSRNFKKTLKVNNLVWIRNKPFRQFHIFI